MRLRTRLHRLERSLVAVGCPACRERRRIVQRTATSLPDGSVVWDVEEPPPCPRCDPIAEQIMEVVLPVVNEST
jgi:hypothetical protein